MARSPHPQAPAPSRRWKRVFMIAGVVAVLAIVLTWAFWPRIQVWMWLGELHSDDGSVRATARDNLAASDFSGLDEKLYEGLVDPDRSFEVRAQVGSILIRRGRMALVENALRCDALAGRTAALAALNARVTQLGEEWFRNDYVRRPEYLVKETLLAWLDREGDLSRLQAIHMAVRLGYEEAVPLLRALARPPHDGPLSAPERHILVAAARGLLAFGNCEVVPEFVEPARSASDDLVRLRMMQILYDAVVDPRGVCTNAVPTETVKGIVLDALDAETNTKHGALLILARQPEWTKEVQDKVLAILDGEHGDTDYVRRAALGAISATDDEAFARRLPRYFHSSIPVIRSEAVTASRAYAKREAFPFSFESCWIGLVRDESGSETAYNGALGALTDVSGKWIGLPAQVTGEAENRRAQIGRAHV